MYILMEKGRAIFTSCPASAMMLKSFKRTTDTSRSWNWISENALSGRNWQTNTVFRKINFKVDSWKNLRFNEGLLAWHQRPKELNH